MDASSGRRMAWRVLEARMESVNSEIRRYWNNLGV